MSNRVFYILALVAVSCAGGPRDIADNSTAYAEFFSIPDDSTVVSLSPYGGKPDTLRIVSPMSSFVCMSSTHVAFLDAIGMDSAVRAVSGLRYVSSGELRSRGDVLDIGYESEVDIERILALKPDLVLTYSPAAMTPPYAERLERLGIRVLILNEHLEDHPLARAEYVRLYGVLTGRRAAADSVFEAVRARYLEICRRSSRESVKKVLLNLPYADQWYVPGRLNYMSRLIEDAGGMVLGAEEGRHESSVISLEQACVLARQADIWLNPGAVRSRRELSGLNPVFAGFRIGGIYNNTLRVNSEGGNDFWESGCVRPDLILEDLVKIMGDSADGSFNYYVEVD